MDVQIPGMDGLQATALIRERECTTGEQIRILAVTGYAMTEDMNRCLAAGTDGYISKPIEPKKLFDAIEAVVSQLP
jgi:two-component system sensor histidine kinase/response regulator